MCEGIIDCFACPYADCIKPEKTDRSEYFRQYYQKNKARINKRNIAYQKRKRREAMRLK